MSPYVVTHRRKVHRRECAHARRIAFPASWQPDVRRAEDHACITCLGGLLPTETSYAAELAADPIHDACSQCGAEPGNDCSGDGEGYHLSRYDRAADRTEETR